MDGTLKDPWRFWSKVERDDNDCWIWQGAKTTNGYGSCLDYLAPKGQGRTTNAHRLSWRLHRGEIPADLQIDHLCRVKLCVNPDHLEAVPQSVNLARRPVKTHCKSGHEFNEENTWMHKGHRRCRQCNRLAVRRFMKAHPEKEREYRHRSPRPS